ncbi:hypothetical protein SynBIOSU31_02090 [Synechococcus sp. BIOS-U3-1]|nr:hypothetical protein SynBIOSU31_02090 [Synechococcus sp. BIOS-U3-1]
MMTEGSKPPLVSSISVFVLQVETPPLLGGIHLLCFCHPAVLVLCEVPCA